MWKLEWTSLDPAVNLAFDEALLEHQEAERGPGVLRIWEPLTLAVILGASGRVAEEVHVAACREDAVPWYRRGSGGGTVVIGPGALNISVVAPIVVAPELVAVDRAQAFVLDAFARALTARGSEVAVRGSGDLVYRDRKCAGSAQRRAKTHVLIHFTVLYAFPLERIARYLAEPKRRPDYRGGRTHDEFVINLPLTRSELIRAASDAYRSLDGDLAPWSLPWPAERLNRLLQSKYADPAWIDRF
mgnify:CR=1 FL=1